MSSSRPWKESRKPQLRSRGFSAYRSLAGLLALLWLVAAGACGSSNPAPKKVKTGYTERGIASWYGPGFHGKRTANGERYNMNAMTAAHRTLPFGTVVEVRNRDNRKTTRVRINDRGPFIRGRIIDLSRGAAKRIDMLVAGTARVEIRVVRGSAPDSQPAAPGRASRSSGKVRYLVQAGAFRDPDQAREASQSLRRNHSDVAIRSDGLWHRVVIGPLKKEKKAEKLAKHLRRQGYWDAFVKVDS